MSITISLFGDFVAQKGADIVIEDGVKSIISRSDISVCNFEAPIKGEYPPFDRVGPRVSQSVHAPDTIKGWGFNVVQLANNHMLDYGNEGCKATLNAFGDIVTVGAGSYDEAYSARIIEIKDTRIGFLSFVHHEFGVWETKNSIQTMGTAWICHPVVSQLITNTKSGVDYLIVLPHAGVEEIDAPIPEWRELYHRFIEWGADAVIGTHPHVPQGWEQYNGKPIFYSLGNFYFDALDSPHPYWQRSIAVELHIKGKEISFKVHNIRYDEGQITLDKEKDVESHNEYLCQLLSDDLYMDYINEMTKKMWKIYQNWLVKGLGAFSFSLGLIQSVKTSIYSMIKKRPQTLLINTLQCESHRWTILRAQKLIEK